MDVSATPRAQLRRKLLREMIENNFFFSDSSSDADETTPKTPGRFFTPDARRSSAQTFRGRGGRRTESVPIDKRGRKYAITRKGKSVHG